MPRPPVPTSLQALVVPPGAIIQISSCLHPCRQPPSSPITMAALIAENFRFLSLFFKSKDVMIFNGLVALGTVGSQELFTVVAFHCPCSPARNYLYGLAAIGVPALALFLIGVILNNHTWNLVAECQYRRTKNCSAAPNFLLLSSIVGRAAVAPVTWSVISLLRGEAYVCALSEFVNPHSLMVGETSFPVAHATEILARFPCGEGPANLSVFREEVSRRLKYESQVRLYQDKLLFSPLPDGEWAGNGSGLTLQLVLWG